MSIQLYCETSTNYPTSPILEISRIMGLAKSEREGYSFAAERVGSSLYVGKGTGAEIPGDSSVLR